MVWTRWLEAYIAFQAHQRDVDKLARLSDHLLADIGLRRDQLDSLRYTPPTAAPRAPERRAPAERRLGVVRPSLEGCG